MLLPVLETLNSKRIILASASENRKNILEKVGLKFEVSPSTFEENLPHSEFQTSAHYVVMTSEMKLNHKLNELKEKGEKVDIIITADTIISLDQREIIEKPQDKDHAFKMIKRYNDFEWHEVQTSVWIAFIDKESMEITKLENILDRTKVFFEKLDDETIQSYVESGEPFGKAGGYGIQGQAASFIQKIEGCYYSVWGFPLSAFSKKIREML